MAKKAMITLRGKPVSGVVPLATGLLSGAVRVVYPSKVSRLVAAQNRGATATGYADEPKEERHENTAPGANSRGF